MKNYNYAIALSATLLLGACGGDSNTVQVNEVNPAALEAEKSRIQFQPAEGRLPLPSDLLFSGTRDGTLEPPDEVAAKTAGEPVDFGNPGAAIGSVDGWSMSTPMLLTVDMAEGSTIDASTVNGASVFMVETNCTLGLQNCTSFMPLTYGVDYAAQVISSTNSIAIAPLAPLNPATTYLVGVTDAVQDSRGEGVVGSEFYQQVSRDDVDLSGSQTLGGLQAAINGYESILAAATGESASSFAYSSAWTTGSIGAGYTGVLAYLAQVSALSPVALSISDVENAGGSPDAVTVRDALISSIAAGLIEQGVDEATAQAQADATVPAAFANGLLLQGQVTLPYYSGTPDDGSDPLLNGWTAACDSGVTLAQASAEDLAASTPGINDASCTAFGLRDLGLDSERHITRYNPIPQVRAQNVLDVQITVPNPALTSSAPWPIAILQHGLGTSKEGMLALSAAMSAAGIATFAIDHPLHGSRTLVSESAGGAPINASGNPALYLNLGQIPVAKDNVNQSVADVLGLRAALNNGITGIYSSADFDLTDISFMGLSLGAITGTVSLEQAQYSAARTAALGLPALDLSMSRALLSSPTGGILPSLIDSGSFGPLTKGSVVAGLAGADGPDFANNFIAFIQGNVANCAPTDLACNYDDYAATLDQAGLAAVQSTLAQFAFAGQTIVNGADPLNFAASLGASGTDIQVIEIIGDGANNLPDQVVPNQSSFAGLAFGGTEPLVALMQLGSVDGSNAPQSSGIVRFTAGHHSSILRANQNAGEAPTAQEIAVQTEMQSQIAAFLSGLGINVFDASNVAPAP